MSIIAIENIIKQIRELPVAEQQGLHALLGNQLHNGDQPPLERRAPLIPTPDYQDALQWLADHAREYAGQWVALDGARLIAHGPDARAVYAAAKTDGAHLPLVDLVEDPDAPPFAGF